MATYTVHLTDPLGGSEDSSGTHNVTVEADMVVMESDWVKFYREAVSIETVVAGFPTVRVLAVTSAEGG